MSEVAPLISDLATILIIAGIITVIFKWLGQPVIVGYIVAVLHCYHRLRHDVPGIYGRQCDGLLTHELYLSGRNAVHVLHRHRIQSIQ